jgi:hypothetical protein
MVDALALISIGLCIQLYLLRYKRNILVTALTGITLLSCIYFYSGQWQWFSLWPKDAVYQEGRGTKPLKAYVHWHEVFNYYLGAKYFPELGYNGLYETVLLADYESGNFSYRQAELRSLREPKKPISANEGLQRAREEFRPKFTDARWQKFTRDVEQFKSLADGGWMDTALFDAGYNPPPSWAVFGYPIANLIPIDQANAWVDGRPHWYMIELLPLFDVLMLFIALALIYRAFGFEAFAAFVILFSTSYVANYMWISGSFFRYTWLFGLIAGICMLKEKRYLLAGIFLGLTSIDRIFPIVFATGAALPLAYQWWMNRKNYKPIAQYLTGFGIAVSVLFLLSLALFGLDAWSAFFTKINIHKNLFFVHHIGYRRIAVFDDLVPGQDFWWGDGLRRMAMWNDRLATKWEHLKWSQLPLMLLTIASNLFAARNIKAEESTLLFGGVVLFFFAIPANYYYIYFPMVAVVLLAAQKSRMRNVIFVALFVLWGFLQCATQLDRDDLIQNYYICCAFFVFFIIWAFGRGYEEIRRIRR